MTVSNSGNGQSWAVFLANEFFLSESDCLMQRINELDVYAFESLFTFTKNVTREHDFRETNYNLFSARLIMNLTCFDRRF